MKKPFNSPVDEELQRKVREKCAKEDIRITDLLEGLLTLYVNDEIAIKKKVSYSLEVKKED